MALTRRNFAVAMTMVGVLPQPVLAAGVSVQRRYVDGPYGQIHLRLARPSDPALETQPPLACFHYSPGSSRMYADILPLLARDRLVMAFDTPGYGNSDAPPQQPMIADYARVLADAVPLLTDAEQIDVFGHLTGSFIAIDMAVMRPDLVRKVVLSRSPVFSDDMRARGTAMFQQLAEQRGRDTEGQYLIDNLEMSLSRRLPGESLDRVIGIYIDSLLAGETWIYGEIAAFSFKANEQMPKLTQPTLYLTWTRDYAGAGTAFGGKETWEGGAALIPHVTTQELTGLEVDAWQKNADIIADQVLAFLDA